MSGQDEGAIHGLARAYESVMAEGFGCCKDAIRAQLYAIRDGEVPGVHLSEHLMGHSMARLQKEITSLRAQLAAAKAEGERVRGELAKAEDEIGELQDASDSARQDRDLAEAERDALAGLLREAFNHIATEGSADGTDLPDRISAALAEKGGGDGWVSTAERMPDGSTEVLAVFPCAKADTVFIVIWDGMTWYDRDGDTFAMHPSFWRPLPTPPATPTKDNQ